MICEDTRLIGRRNTSQGRALIGRPERSLPHTKVVLLHLYDLVHAECFPPIVGTAGRFCWLQGIDNLHHMRSRTPVRTGRAGLSASLPHVTGESAPSDVSRVPSVCTALLDAKERPSCP